MRFIVDSSVALSWCFKDERTAESLLALEALRNGGADVPALWPLEIANGMVTAIRKKRIDLDVAEAFLSSLGRAKFTVWPAESDPSALFVSAQKHKLTPYDATYVDLAIRLGLPLATFDGDMRAAALRAGVPLLV